MDKIKSIAKIVASAVQEIIEFWFSLFVKAATAALLVLLSAMGFAIIFEMIVRLVSPFFGTTVTSLFTTPYLVSICAVYIPIFLFLLLHYSAHKYKEAELVVNKLTWKDVKIKILSLRKDDVISAALVIHNNKPFILKNVKANLVYTEIAKQDRTHLNSWQLGWLEDRKYSWEEKDINSGEERRLALFNAYLWEGRTIVFIPGPDGQPKERKAVVDFDSVDKYLIIDLKFSGKVDGSEMETNTVRIRAEIINNEVNVKSDEEYLSKKINVSDNA